MPFNAPNALTLLRIILIPVLVVVYYLPGQWTNVAATVIFVAAGVTDWLDGYLARRWDQGSAFGAFLDPVADKLMVAVALVLLATDPRVVSEVFNRELFTVVIAIIIGREIVVSALREWMAEIGKRASVAVSFIAKHKTAVQFVAIAVMLYREPLLGWSMLKVGELMLLAAAALTLWTMVIYLRTAWPELVEGGSRSAAGRHSARPGVDTPRVEPRISGSQRE